jgi:hypothetical protein
VLYILHVEDDGELPSDKGKFLRCRTKTTYVANANARGPTHGGETQCLYCLCF